MRNNLDIRDIIRDIEQKNPDLQIKANDFNGNRCFDVHIAVEDGTRRFNLTVFDEDFGISAYLSNGDWHAIGCVANAEDAIRKMRAWIITN
jgi:hypothetical protein